MRHHALITLCAAATFGLASSACSLLGGYVSSASSMMSQPGANAGMASAPSTPTPAAAGAPASTEKAKEADDKDKTPSTVSVSVHNDCPETVKLFFGNKPKFGSGRYSSIGSNTRTNHTFKPGDQLWIVDDGQNGIESVTVEAGTRSIEITSSCDAFRTR